MKRRSTFALAAVCAGLALLSACGTSSTSGGAGQPGNAANASVVNASDKTGGTLKLLESDAPDSTDPGNTYYAYTWDFERLYARTLLTFNPAPGAAGLKVVPDLATGLGQVSSDGLTWTYHLKSGVKFEDGEAVTSQDVKYAIERSANYSPDVLGNGPVYFAQYLAPQTPAYAGAYKDNTPNKQGLQSITTPDATTIVFHLKQPFADFDYLVTDPETSPVPPDKDKGADYQNHPLSTGPYMFQSYSPNKSLTLVKNPQWNASTDPNRKQLVNEIDVTFGVNQDDVDNRLISGDADIDLQGNGLQPDGRAKALGSSTLAKQTDAALSGRLWYISLNTQVAPLNNVHCREAVEYGIDKVAAQTAYGGPIAGGQIASTLLPPNITGYQKYDDYEALTKPHGDDTKAKQQLQLCGKPNGFTVNIAARSDRAPEMAAAQAAQQSLAKIGIKTDIQSFPHGQYFSNFAGVPNYVHQHDLGILMMGWQADWPTGFGFLQQIVDGGAIKSSGNSNIQEENNPQVNQLLNQAASSTDANQRNQIYGQIDKLVMKDAVIVPEVYATALLYRNPEVSNVYVSQAYGMYDYTQLGLNGSS
jgi:peptide/nickel transport system substrate-binding protein